MSKYENAEAYMLQLAIKRAEAEKKKRETEAAEREIREMKSRRAQLMCDERAKGKTHREIAEMFGVSRQRVAQICGRNTGVNFKGWTPERCIYPNIRNWMNENQISMNEFLRRLGQNPGTENRTRYYSYFRGKAYPQKKAIDKMIAVTGLTYEQLWEVDHD